MNNWSHLDYFQMEVLAQRWPLLHGETCDSLKGSACDCRWVCRCLMKCVGVRLCDAIKCAIKSEAFLTMPDSCRPSLWRRAQTKHTRALLPNRRMFLWPRNHTHNIQNNHKVNNHHPSPRALKVKAVKLLCTSIIHTTSSFKKHVFTTVPEAL